MTAKEKSKELVDKFYTLNNIEATDMPIQVAKECALICVDEISEAYSGDILEFWQEVKQEIEKL